MSLLVKHCDRHPDRRAIGVCVVTSRAICRECATQYQGVNYSKEGLEQLLAEERSATQHTGRHGWMMAALLTLFVPIGLYLTYVGFDGSGQMIVDLMQLD